jgi:hypothetical protein
MSVYHFNVPKAGFSTTERTIGKHIPTTAGLSYDRAFSSHQAVVGKKHRKQRS